MPDRIVCYRCGESLAALTLPFSRRDMCPACSAHVHVCRMCSSFDPRVTGQCLEDDAEDVLDKDRVNFCDWFEPRGDAFDPSQRSAQARAESELASLFGGADTCNESDNDSPARDAPSNEAEDLFK